MTRARRSKHHRHRVQRVLCREHAMSQEFFLPQIRRLLRPGPFGDRSAYDAIVRDIVSSKNPLDLFEGCRKRAGIVLIEAVYLTHAEFAVAGDHEVPIPALGYSRWVAWRRFEEAVRSGTLPHGRSLRGHIEQSCADMREHIRNGWRPTDNDGEVDAELCRLLEN